MKKIMLMSTTIILTTLLCVVPFSVHASTSMFNATSGQIENYDGNYIGRYNVYTAIATNSNLQFYFMDQFFDYDQYKSASITDIQFNDSYDNYITLVYGSNLTDELIWVESDGSAQMRINQTAINLTLNDVSWIRIYVVSIDTTANNIQPTDFTTTLTKSTLNIDFNQIIQNDLIGKYFPYENFVLYLWAKSYGPFVEYSPTDIPFIQYKTSFNDNAYTEAHHIQIKNGVNDFYFLCNWAVNSNRVNLYFRGDASRITYSVNQIVGWSNGLYVINIHFENAGGINYFDMELLGNVYVYPIWYTQGGHIPDRVAELLQMDYNNTYTDLLKAIRDALAAQGDPNTSSDIEDTSDDLSDISGQINTITDAVDIDFNNNINNIDLDDHDFFTGLTNTTNYFKVYVQDFYNNIGDVKALLIVPVIVTIMMMIAGWMF